MHRLHLYGLALLAFVFTVPTTYAQDFDLSDEIPFDSQVRTGRLENGFTYYIKYNQKPEQKAEFRLAVNAGSILETDEQQGLAHFLEHMGFNGTEHFEKNELIHYLQSVGVRFGAHLNAYTSFDETVYMLNVPTDQEEVFDKAFLVMEDWAHNMLLTEEEIDKERGVVIEEWRLSRGPYERMMQEYMPVMLSGSRYASRLPIGKKKVLDEFGYETLRSFYRDWYRPDLMALVVVGDIDVDKVEEKIKIHFGRMTASDQGGTDRPVYEVPDHEEPRAVVTSDPEASGTSVMIYNKTDVQTPESLGDLRKELTVRLLNDILGKRLAELRESEDPPFNYAYTYKGNIVRTKAAHIMLASCAEDQSMQALTALLMEAERLKRYGILEQELDRAKRSVMLQIETAAKEKDKQPSNRVVGKYVYHFLRGNPVIDEDFYLDFAQAYLEDIRLAEVVEASEGLTKHDNVVIVVMGLEKEGVQLPEEEEVLAALERVQEMEIAPYQDQLAATSILETPPQPGKIVSEKTYESTGLTELKFSNGLTVMLKPTDFQNDEIKFIAYSKGGYWSYGEEDYWTANKATSLVSEMGAGPFTNADLRKLTAGKKISLTAWMGDNMEGLTGSTSPGDLEEALKLVYLRCTQPRFDSSAYQSYLTRQKAGAQNVFNNPYATFYEASYRIMSQDHPLRNRIYHAADYDKIDAKRAVEIFAEKFGNPADFYVSLVGNFDIETVKPLLATYLGGIPSSNRKDVCIDHGIRPPEGMEMHEVKKGSDPKSMVQINFSGTYTFHIEEEHRMKTLAEVLTNRLIFNLREDKSGVYGVGARFENRAFPYPLYQASITFPCGPENVESLSAEVIAEVEDLRTNGPDPDELEKVQNAQRLALKEQLKTNGYWQDIIWSIYIQGANPETVVDDLHRQVESIDAETIRQTAEKYLTPDRYVRIVLNPEGLSE